MGVNKMKSLKTLLLSAALAVAVIAPFANAAEPGEEVIARVLATGAKPPVMAPARGAEAQGPYQQLLITNVNIIDGTGAPTQGPYSILIEGNRIVSIGEASGGAAAKSAARVIDGEGGYILPGFIDTHDHIGTPNHIYGGELTDPGYVFKLMLAHGITTIRDVGSMMGLKWTLEHKKLSEEGKITAPRVVSYAVFPAKTATAEEAVKWVKAVHKTGADGVKFLGADPKVFAAAIKEINALGMGSAYHHSQTSVTRHNALDSARLGVQSIEHWYGLPEAMFEDRTVQHYPNDYNYNNEQDRFGQAGRLWQQTAKPGSERWNSTIRELVDLDVTLDPTFSIYEASRDLMRARTQEWLPDYGMPYILKAFEANPEAHGSFFFNWTTADEIAWRKNYELWMQFVRDFKNAGGRVTVGPDTGFIYSIYGFGYVRELEMLQEAGFHPLEVIRAATLSGAELLRKEDDYGTVAVGKRADLVLVKENPLANFKQLYGTGFPHYDFETKQNVRTNGIRYTIRDGIVFDVPKLLEQVRAAVKAKNAEYAAKAE